MSTDLQRIDRIELPDSSGRSDWIARTPFGHFPIVPHTLVYLNFLISMLFVICALQAQITKNDEKIKYRSAEGYEGILEADRISRIVEPLWRNVMVNILDTVQLNNYTGA